MFFQKLGVLGFNLVRAGTDDTMLLASFLGIVSAYREGLRLQVGGAWQTLPAELIAILAPHYDIDLSSIRYAVANTVHGQATTFENEIFFPEAIDLRNRSHLRWMLHELEHTVQYKQLGGFHGFLTKYFLEIVTKVKETSSVNVHDILPLEVGADAKADRLIDEVSLTMALRVQRRQ